MILKNIDCTKKNQSATYLVFSTGDAQLLGYFTLTIKPIAVNAESFSDAARRRLSRVSTLDEKEHTYSLAAYLIAQPGKDYTEGASYRISGAELLGLAMNQIELLLYQAGGMVMFLETTIPTKCEAFWRIGFYLLNNQGFQRITPEVFLLCCCKNI